MCAQGHSSRFGFVFRLHVLRTCYVLDVPLGVVCVFVI